MRDSSYTLTPIGYVHKMDSNKHQLKILPKYRPGLHLLELFSHLVILWWADGYDNLTDRNVLNVQIPLDRFPDAPRCGVFASRSPARPNPVMLSVIINESVDQIAGVITTPFIDANDKTPIIDIKPYLPSSDRVQQVVLPQWMNWLNRDFSAPGVPLER